MMSAISPLSETLWPEYVKGSIYPISIVYFSDPEISTKDATVTTGPGVHYNYDLPGCWTMDQPGKSFISTEFSMNSSKCANKFTLNLLHLYSGEGFSPIKITINGRTITANYSFDSREFVCDSFDVTSYLIEGQNKINIEFLPGATGNYSIKALSIFAS